MDAGTGAAAPPAPPPSLSADLYLTQLAGLNTTSTSAVNSFRISTQLRQSDPVPLGSHAGTVFVLQPNTDTVRRAEASTLTALDEMRGTSPALWNYSRVSIPNAGGGSCDLKYGFGLGSMQYWVGAAGQTGSYLEKAGFYVLLDAVDHSVWISTSLENEVDGETIDPSKSTLWGWVPGDDDLQVGTMRISQANWRASSPLSITAGDPFAGNAVLACTLESKPAIQAKLDDAWKASKGG